MLRTLHFEADADPADVAEQVRSVWASSTVIHIVGPKPNDDIRDFYWEVLTRIGHPTPMAEDVSLGDRSNQRSGAYWAEVRYEPGVENAYRHSANAQPLHTDASYISTTGLDIDLSSTANATGFLGCVAMPEGGGATTFIDAADLVEVLRAENPALLARLENTIVPHARSGDRRAERIIRFEEGGPRTNWNYYCVDQSAGDDVAKLRQEFFDFLQTSAGVAERTNAVKLRPGEGVLWKDDQTLHGREAFNPTARSDRFLWKTGLMVEA